MLGLSLFFVLTSLSEGWPIPWYPYMLPVHSGGYHHRHTTHIVTHPVYHTRLLVLGSDDHHRHYRQNYGHSHFHGHDGKHGQQPYHRYRSYGHHDVQGRSKGQGPKSTRRPKTQARYQYRETGEHHDGHYEDEYPHGDKFSSRDPVEYSVPVSESPWKPLYHVPKSISNHGEDIPDRVPLNYLGIDDERVARVVKQAMEEIDEDMENESRPRYPTSINDLIGSPVKTAPAVTHGAVFYDEDDVPRERRVKSKPRYTEDYFVPKDTLSKDPRSFKLNIECQCLAPHAR